MRRLGLFLLVCTLSACGSGNKQDRVVYDDNSYFVAQSCFWATEMAAGYDTGVSSIGSQSSLQDTQSGASRLQIGEPKNLDFGDMARHTRQKLDQSTGHAIPAIEYGCSTTRLFTLTADANQGSDNTFTGAFLWDPNSCTQGHTVDGTALLEGSVAGQTRHIEIEQHVTDSWPISESTQITPRTAGKPSYIIDASGLPESGSVALTILVDEHHRRDTSFEIAVEFDVASDATDPVRVMTHYETNRDAPSSPYVTGRTIVSGTHHVTHTTAKKHFKETFDNVSYTFADCRCPKSGSIREDVTYDDTSEGAYSRTYTFVGCGVATVTTTSSTSFVDSGVTAVTWADCTMP